MLLRPTDYHRPAARRTAARLMLAITVLSGLGACSRPPLDPICPPLVPGDLVITEVRGPQSESDNRGQWIEITNRRSQDTPLSGVTLRLSGTSSEGADILIRDRSLLAIAGGYVVLGRFPSDVHPDFVQYGFQVDYDNDIGSTGIIELLSCGVLIDRFVYKSALPKSGTLAFDGARTPDATANDDEAAWCNDQTPDETDGGVSFVGLPGTPGRRNHACPARP